jgi:hypothetical protein
VALGTFFGGLLSADADQRAGSLAVACNFIGRGYVNPMALQGTAVAYFTDIPGISGSLFNGSPSEKTAFFTWRNDVLSLTQLPVNGSFGFYLGSAGSSYIYFNPNPNGDWSNLDTFSGGKLPGNPIAQFAHPEALFFTSEFVSKHVHPEILMSSQPFTFNGHTYDFKNIAPDGLTFIDLINASPDVPGVIAEQQDFPVGLSFAGNCFGLPSKQQDEEEPSGTVLSRKN